MAVEELTLELPWIFTVAFLLVIIVIIAVCVCFKKAEKTQVYGTAGRLSITRDSPIIQLRSSNGNAIAVLSPEQDSVLEDGNFKRNSWTVKDRALPDIPKTVVPSVNSNSISYSGNGDIPKAETSANKKKNYNKPLAPKPPFTENAVKNSPASTVALQKFSKAVDKQNSNALNASNDKSQISENSSVSVSGLGARPKIQVNESIPGTSNSVVILKKVEKMQHEVSSECDVYNYETLPGEVVHVQSTPVSPSPVQTRIDIPEASEQSNSVPLASLAVAGAVPSSDIPYMTPPLLHNSSVTESEDNMEETGRTRSELPYTVISVREPLARVREMTKKQKIAVHQNSDEGPDHYAMVPEEEQMYAEIGSGQNSGSSSITYAHIEPRELPPVPPTVESLKSVAHAHSRQASTVSSSSFGSCMSNADEPTSPQLRNSGTPLYSSVEKNDKQRRTIHVAEGASVMSTLEKHKKVEDLYAKVRKKRVDLTINTTNPEDYSGYQDISGENNCITPPPSPWASTTPPAPPPITGRLHAAALCVPSNSAQHLRRHSADPNVPESLPFNSSVDNNLRLSFIINRNETCEPGYERIYNEDDNISDSCYEKIKDTVVGFSKKLIDGYESVDQCCSLQSDTSYTGYESMKEGGDSSLDPGYECVSQLSDSNFADPGYEPVRILEKSDDSSSNHGYTVVKINDGKEPDYEIVKKLHRTESDAADPGYEKIRKLSRTESDATDPGYERVRAKPKEGTDGEYDSVQRSDSDTDPGYESVRHGRESGNDIYAVVSNENSSLPSVTHSTTYPNSTILFVSQHPEPRVRRYEPTSKGISKEPSVEDEANATSL